MAAWLEDQKVQSQSTLAAWHSQKMQLYYYDLLQYCLSFFLLVGVYAKNTFIIIIRYFWLWLQTLAKSCFRLRLPIKAFDSDSATLLLKLLKNLDKSQIVGYSIVFVYLSDLTYVCKLIFQAFCPSALTKYCRLVVGRFHEITFFVY